MGEEARHQDSGPEITQPRLRPLAVRELQRELRVAASRGKGQRKGAAEARVHVGDLVAPVGLAEALDRAGPDEAERLGHLGAELDQITILDRHPLDRLATLGLDHRARDRVQAAGVEVAEDVDRELLAPAGGLDERVDRRVAEEEVELGPIGGAEDVARAEALAHLDEQRVARVVRHLLGEPARRRRDPALLEEEMRRVLVADAANDLLGGQQHERPELVPCPRRASRGRGR